MKWIKDQYLLIPSYFVPAKKQKAMTELDKTMAVCVGYKKVLDGQFTFDQLKKELSEYSAYDCLGFLSKLGIILENDWEFSPKLQSIVVNQVFSPKIRSGIASVLKKEGRNNYFVLSQKQALRLMKYSILFAQKESKKGFQDTDNLFGLTKLLLVTNDLFEGEVKKSGSNKIDKKELIKFAIQNNYLSSNENMINLIARYVRLFQEIPLEMKRRGVQLKFDLGREFYDATTFEIKEYSIVGFSLVTNFVQVRVSNEGIKDELCIINRKTFFENTQIANMAPERIFDSFCTNLDDARVEISKQPIGSEEFMYNYVFFKKHPLFEFEKDCYRPINLRFLKDKITSGIYWVLFDHIKEKHGDKALNLFTSFFGEIFECYICEMFGRIYPAHPLLANMLCGEIKYFKNKEELKSSDLMLFYGDKAIFIEIKSSRLAISRTSIIGDYLSLEKDLDDIVVKGARQLDRVINDFKLGHLKIPGINPKAITRYYPIVITLESFPQLFVIWEMINERLKNNNLLRGNDCAQLQIIDSEEMEMLEPLISGGDSFVDIIDEKINDESTKNIPIKNFLYYGKYNRRSVANEYLASVFSAFSESAREYLFGGKDN